MFISLKKPASLISIAFWGGFLFTIIGCSKVDEDILLLRIIKKDHYSIPESEPKSDRLGYVPGGTTDEKFLVDEDKRIVEVSDKLFMPQKETMLYIDSFGVLSGYINTKFGQYFKLDHSENNYFQLMEGNKVKWGDLQGSVTIKKSTEIYKFYERERFKLYFLIKEVRDNGDVVAEVNQKEYIVKPNEKKILFKYRYLYIEDRGLKPGKKEHLKRSIDGEYTFTLANLGFFKRSNFIYKPPTSKEERLNYLRKKFYSPETL